MAGQPAVWERPEPPAPTDTRCRKTYGALRCTQLATRHGFCTTCRLRARARDQRARKETRWRPTSSVPGLQAPDVERWAFGDPGRTIGEGRPARALQR